MRRQMPEAVPAGAPLDERAGRVYVIGEHTHEKYAALLEKGQGPGEGKNLFSREKRFSLPPEPSAFVGNRGGYGGRVMAKMRDIKKIDRNMDFREESREGMDWHTVDDPGFVLEGLYWRKPGEAFRRLPFGSSVSEGVDYLAGHTAGVMARFRTDAPEIRLRAVFDDCCKMDHMPCTGVMGFDLYEGSHAAKFYRKTTRFDYKCGEYTVTMFGPEAERKMREFTLHFPLYAHPSEVRIGLSAGARVLPPSPWQDPRPVAVYGTSIQQGGCASRPGMCHTNIMSRMLDRPFINLAFSGSGRGEPAMAELMAQIADPAMFVLDYDANAGVEGLRRTLSGFVDILRAKHPATPILLVSRLPLAGEFSGQEFPQVRYDLTAIHMEELRKRREAGDENIHFLDGTTLYGPDPSECTVDGCHATDLGFYNIARRMAPVIERILTQA